MTTPPELLEQSLEAHGDTLYHLALVAAGDEAGAARLLRDLAAALAQPAAASAPLDEPALVARLVAVARTAAEREAARRRPGSRPAQPRANLFAPFALHHLPLDQRLAIALHLLLGYDGPRMAAALGGDVAGARAALVAGARALGPAAGAALTDRVSGEQCDVVRALLADPSAGSRQSAGVRGHLAGCAPCRAFDQAWGSILASVEEALRGALRGRALPAPLRARMLALAVPRRGRRAPAWRLTRLALAPLGVLALILAIALPGFMRQPVSVVDHAPGPPVDAQALIARSLARHAAPPARTGVWYGRFETLWYFGDDVVAPLRAEAWLDPRTPARHRLQITHRDGGAPYELQIGDGGRQLAYALDAAYAPALYGRLQTTARISEPALVAQPLDAAGQTRARDERLRSGPWSLPPAYLHQARQAADLRLLGRQRDGGRVVQLLSFSGVSPLGLPPDAPGATAERVTVLLALDSEDGLLRSATELAGPAGSAQTGRVTWRLVDEQWLTGIEQIAEAFEVERAWTGIGNFHELPPAPSADPAMPLIAARAVGDPAALFSMGRLPFWLPARPPPGVDRALLIWDGRDRQDGNPPSGLVYLGAGRRLVLAFNSGTALAGERFVVGPWRVTLQAGRGQRYSAALARAEVAPELREWGLFDASALMLLDATGFSRAELEALVASLAPFDLAALAAQDELFTTPSTVDRTARAALLQAAYATAAPPAGSAWHTTSRWFIRQMPGLDDPRRDPYHLPLHEGRPEVTRAEEWQAGAGRDLALFVEVHAPQGDGPLTSRYTDAERYWRFLPRAGALELWSPLLSPYTIRLPMAAATALDLLNQPGELALEPLPGGSVVRHSENARSSPRYGKSVLNPSPAEPYLFDLQPLTMTTELELSPAGEATAVRIYAEGREGQRRTLVESYELVGREVVPLAEAPAHLREGEPPAAALVREFRFDAPQAATVLRRDALDQTLPLPGGPLYVPEEGAADLLSVDEGPVLPPGAYVDYSAVGGVLEEAIARRLAISAVYRVPAGEQSPDASFNVRITQGPAEQLAAFLRSSPAVPWDTSEPALLEAAGAERQGWYGAGARTYVLVELDGALLVVDAPRPPDDPQLRAFLMGLRPAD